MEHEKKPELDLQKDFPPPTWDEWLQAVNETLKGADFNKVMQTKTYEGITLQPIYRKEDLQDLEHLDTAPGRTPYIRGNSETGYLNGGWKIAQKQVTPCLKTLNQELLEELKRGLNSINLVLNHKTTKGLLPSSGENGIAFLYLEDILKALQGIDLSAVPILMDGQEAAILFLALLNAYAKKHEIPLSKLSGTIGMDPLAILSQHGLSQLSYKQLMDFLFQMAFWADLKAPGIRTIAIDGTVYASAGANSVQELGIILSTAISYINVLLDKGLSIEQISPRFQVNLGLGSNFYMEIAKVRALRLAWAELVRNYGGSEPAQKVWIHGVTSSFNKSKYDAYVNVLRTSTEAFAAVIGGVDSLCIETFDNLLNQPNEFSKRVARNQQLILQEEAHFDRVIDPAGGCYYIEKLTSQITEKAWKQMQDIEAKGGMLKSLKDGYIHSETSKMMQERISNVEKRRDIFVGINMFSDADEIPKQDHSPLKTPDYAKKVTGLKEQHKQGLSECLSYIRDNHQNDFIVDMITDAWLHGACLDQISEAMGFPVDIQQQSQECSSQAEILSHGKLMSVRVAQTLENLRDRVIASKLNNSDPGIFLLNLGTISEFKARADFSAGFLSMAGFRVINNTGYSTVEEALMECDKHAVTAICICSTDEKYQTLVPEVCSKANNKIIILAGYPTEQVNHYQQCGVKHFIHLRANALEVLTAIAKDMGVEA